MCSYFSEKEVMKDERPYEYDSEETNDNEQESNLEPVVDEDEERRRSHDSDSDYSDSSRDSYGKKRKRRNRRCNRESKRRRRSHDSDIDSDYSGSSRDSYGKKKKRRNRNRESERRRNERKNEEKKIILEMFGDDFKQIHTALNILSKNSMRANRERSEAREPSEAAINAPPGTIVTTTYNTIVTEEVKDVPNTDLEVQKKDQGEITVVDVEVSLFISFLPPPFSFFVVSAFIYKFIIRRILTMAQMMNRGDGRRKIRRRRRRT